MTGEPDRADSKPFRSRRLALCLLCVTLSAFGSCKKNGTPVASLHDLAPQPRDSWISKPSRAGAERCGDCHEQLVSDWSRTAMARALGPVEPAEFADLQSVSESGAEYSYRFELDSGSAHMIESSSVAPEYSRSLPLAFAIGAGVQDRAYAASTGEFLWFAPLEVLTTGSTRSAALSPMHAQAPGSRFTIPITPECLGCHTDTLPQDRFPQNLRSAPVDWQPRGISCAACHGDVNAHANWQESAAPMDERDPVLRLASLSRTERLSICAACHLQGDARIVLGDGEQGPPPPGNDLLEQRAVFVAAEPNQDVGFVSHVERLVLSRCFTESPQMDCVSCHDPHRDKSSPQEKQHVRASCNNCHANQQPPAGSTPAPDCNRPSKTPAESRDCVSCHMRRTEVFDVLGVTVHDHLIAKSPGPSSHFTGTRSLEAPDGNWRRFTWPNAPAPVHIEDPGLALMANYSRGFFEQARAFLPRASGDTASLVPMVHHARGALLQQQEQLEDAAAAYATALQLNPTLGPSAVNLGAVLAQLGRPDAALAILNTHLQHHPQSPSGMRNRALVRSDLGDIDGLIRDLESAIELLPTAERARELADLWTQVGDRKKANSFRQQAKRLDP